MTRRLWLVAGLVALVVGVRAALPVAARVAIERTAPSFLRARVAVGDVDLALLRGDAALEDVAVRAEGEEGAPLLEWKRLAVEIDWLPLLRRSLELREVTLEAPALRLARRGDGRLNLLELLRPAEEGEAEAPAEEGESGGGGWHVSVARLRIDAAALSYRDEAVPDAEPLEVAWGLEARNLLVAGAEDTPFELRLETAGGSVTAEGRLALAPLALRGDLRWQDLSLPALLAVAPGPEATWLKSGRSSGALSIEAGGEGSGGDVRVTGELRVPELSFAMGERGPAVDWRELRLELRELRVPGALARSDAGEPASGGPIEIALAELALSEPSVKLAVGPDGIEGLAGDQSGGGEAPAEAPPAAGASPLRLVIDSLALERGEVEVADRSVTPAVDAALGIEGTLGPVRWPDLAVQGIQLGGSALGTGAWKVGGGFDPRGGRLSVDLQRLPLPPLGAYASRAVGYGIERGEASLQSEIELEGDRYATENQLVLYDAAIGRASEGESLFSFQDQIGMSLPLAVSLLRDARGQIALALPVSGARTGAGIGLQGFASALQSVLRQTLLAALSTPLKAVGVAVSVVKGAETPFSLQPIAFQPGSDEVTAEGREQVAGLARFLESRSTLAVVLEGVVTEGDASARDALARADRARDLAKRRAQRVQQLLLEEQGVDAAQVSLEPPPVAAADGSFAPAAGAPRVELRLRMSRGEGER